MLSNLRINNNSNAHISSSSSSSSSSRAPLIGRLNVALANKHQLQNNLLTSLGATGGNLSPSILVEGNGSSPSVISINNALTTRQPTAVTSLRGSSTSGGVGVSVTAATPITTPTVLVQVNKPVTNQVESVPQPPPPPLQQNPKQDQNQDVTKCIYLGDYVFIEPGCPTDTFGTAYNLKTRQSYFWKKFERRDYMKKLEPYFVMEGSCDKIYKFAEIILQSNYPGSNTTSDQDWAFVLFEPHYGDLHSFMKEKKRLDEPEARLVFHQCVEAVHACHENGIIIRDIKLKKFVFLDSERTKIGLANLEDCLLLDEDAENDLIKSQQGCPAYVSPEVLNPFQTSYSGKLSDSWSLGIILYTLLVGRYPFHHPTIANMFARIARGKFQVPMPISLSMDARTLLRSLIRVKPDERLQPDEILAHNWFRQNENEYRPTASIRMTMFTAATASNTNTATTNMPNTKSQQQQTNPNLMISKIHLGGIPNASNNNNNNNNNTNTNKSTGGSSNDDCCVPQLSE